MSHLKTRSNTSGLFHYDTLVDWLFVRINEIHKYVATSRPTQIICCLDSIIVNSYLICQYATQCTLIFACTAKEEIFKIINWDCDNMSVVIIEASDHTRSLP